MEINVKGAASMEWWQQLMAAAASGACALYTLQQILDRIRKKPEDEPVGDSERAVIESSLKSIRDNLADQTRQWGTVMGRLDRLDGRVNALEGDAARVRAQGRSKRAGTD